MGRRNSHASLEANEPRSPSQEEEKSFRGEPTEVDSFLSERCIECFELHAPDLFGHLGDLRSDRSSMIAECEELGAESGDGLVLTDVMKERSAAPA